MARNRTLGSPFEQQLVSADFTTEHNIDRYIVIGPGPVVTATLDPNAFNGDQVTLLNAPNVTGSVNIVPSPGQVLIGASTISVPGDSVLLTFLDLPESGLPPVWTAQYQSANASTAPSVTFLSGTTIANGSSSFTFSIPIAPPGVDPATYSGTVSLILDGMAGDADDDWATIYVVAGLHNENGTLDLGTSPPEMAGNTSTSLTGAGGVTATTSAGAPGFLNLTVSTRALPGSPTINWKLGYTVTTNP